MTILEYVPARDVEQARRIACSLEAELAEQTARVAEALSCLASALVWVPASDVSSNARDWIAEAMSALEGET